MQSERAEDKPTLSESDELLPISGLQHVVFCPRQAALIHVERVWRENSATTHGKILHERVDQPGQDRRAGVIIKRAVPLRSDRLRIAGLADTVEYHEDAAAPDGLRPFPVEYKRGGKRRLADEVQLCAQALCLAELHGCSVRHGALYYGAIKRRVEVEFTEQLQARTEQAVRAFRALVDARKVPAPEPGAKCRECSLAELCMPEACAKPGRAARYLAALSSGLDPASYRGQEAE